MIKQRTLANDGMYVADDQIKLGDYLEQYFSSVSIHKLGPRTYEREVSIVRKHIIPTLGNIHL